MKKNDSSIARKISGSVVWDDADNTDRVRPKKVRIALYANGEAVQETTAKAKKDWAFAFKKLPKYDETDQRILYSVKQESIMRLYAVYPSEKERNYKKRPTFSLKVDPS